MYSISWTFNNTVFVKMPTRNIVKLDVPWPYSVEVFKQMISKDMGILPPHQQITFNGRVLEDGHRFHEYDIEEGSTLDLVVRPGSKYIC